MDISLLNLKKIRRRAQARIDWDGGCALPKEVPPETIVALVDEVERLKVWLYWISRDSSGEDKESARRALRGDRFPIGIADGT
mgnify:CR=1 FL=1